MRHNYSKEAREKIDEIRICNLVDKDVFGYYELLENDIKVRSCTVKCISNDATVTVLEKSALAGIFRYHPRVLETMKIKWTRFLVERVSNKLFVEQLRLKADDSPEK